MSDMGFPINARRCNLVRMSQAETVQTLLTHSSLPYRLQ